MCRGYLSTHQHQSVDLAWIVSWFLHVCQPRGQPRSCDHHAVLITCHSDSWHIIAVARFPKHIYTKLAESLPKKTLKPWLQRHSDHFEIHEDPGSTKWMFSIRHAAPIAAGSGEPTGLGGGSHGGRPPPTDIRVEADKGWSTGHMGGGNNQWSSWSSSSWGASWGTQKDAWQRAEADFFAEFNANTTQSQQMMAKRPAKAPPRAALMHTEPTGPGGVYACSTQRQQMAQRPAKAPPIAAREARPQPFQPPCPPPTRPIPKVTPVISFTLGKKDAEPTVKAGLQTGQPSGSSTEGQPPLASPGQSTGPRGCQGPGPCTEVGVTSNMPSAVSDKQTSPLGDPSPTGHGGFQFKAALTFSSDSEGGSGGTPPPPPGPPPESPGQTTGPGVCHQSEGADMEDTSQAHHAVSELCNEILRLKKCGMPIMYTWSKILVPLYWCAAGAPHCLQEVASATGLDAAALGSVVEAFAFEGLDTTKALQEWVSTRNSSLVDRWGYFEADVQEALATLTRTKDIIMMAVIQLAKQEAKESTGRGDCQGPSLSASTPPSGSGRKPPPPASPPPTQSIATPPLSTALEPPIGDDMQPPPPKSTPVTSSMQSTGHGECQDGSQKPTDSQGSQHSDDKEWVTVRDPNVAGQQAYCALSQQQGPP